MDEYVFRLTNLRKEIKKLKYIKLQEVDDISKIVLVVNDGKNLYDKLLNDYGIQLEMASVNYCINHKRTQQKKQRVSQKIHIFSGYI